MVEELFFDDRKAVVAAVAETIAARLSSAIAARGAATLVASGGSTPEPVYRELANAAVLWDRVTITLSDERWGPGRLLQQQRRNGPEGVSQRHRGEGSSRRSQD